VRRLVGAGAGVVEEQQEREIPAPLARPPVRGLQERLDLGRVEVGEGRRGAAVVSSIQPVRCGGLK
jgi:hypothetical protein